MHKILYRHNQNLGATPTDALSVLTFETMELGNTDIPEYCLEHYNFPSATKSLIEGLVKHIEGDEGITVSEKGYPFILGIMLDHIRKETGIDVKHVLWLAPKQSVIDNYEGTEENIEAYETSPVILSDLGEDGVLFGYDHVPQQCDTENESMEDHREKRYIHPADPGCNKHHVTKQILVKGKTEYVHIAFFDPPGTYYDDEWNVHFDGCDYPCPDLDACKTKLDSLAGPGDYATTTRTFQWGYEN